MGERTGYPPFAQRLLFERKSLVDGSSSLRELDIADGSTLTLLIVESAEPQLDTFDATQCEDGNQISADGRTVTKAGGADLTSTFGTVRVSSGVHEWHIKVEGLGTRDHSNVMIGVCRPDMPLDFVQKVWHQLEETDAHKYCCVKSSGNTSSYW